MSQPRQYTAENLLVRPQNYSSDPGLILSITPAEAGWDYISFQVRRLASGESWSWQTAEHELALVNLTGRYAVTSSRGEWSGIGGRRNVLNRPYRAGGFLVVTFV